MKPIVGSMKTLDPAGRIAALQAGIITLILRPGLPVSRATLIPGTSAVILGGDDLLADFRAWLDDHQVDDAARALGISRAKVGRMRAGLGLSKKYDRQSRTTTWRRGKEQS